MHARCCIGCVYPVRVQSRLVMLVEDMHWRDRLSFDRRPKWLDSPRWKVGTLLVMAVFISISIYITSLEDEVVATSWFYRSIVSHLYGYDMVVDHFSKSERPFIKASCLFLMWLASPCIAFWPLRSFLDSRDKKIDNPLFREKRFIKDYIYLCLQILFALVFMYFIIEMIGAGDLKAGDKFGNRVVAGSRMDAGAIFIYYGFVYVWFLCFFVIFYNFYRFLGGRR